MQRTQNSPTIKNQVQLNDIPILNSSQTQPSKQFHNPFENISPYNPNLIAMDNEFNHQNLNRDRFNFKAIDFERNPMIESIDCDLPHVGESQVINKNRTGKKDKMSQFFHQYEAEQLIENFQQENENSFNHNDNRYLMTYNQPYSNHNFSDLYTRQSDQNQFQSQRNEATNENIQLQNQNQLDDFHYDRLEFNERQDHIQKVPSKKQDEETGSNQTGNLQIFSRNSQISNNNNQLKSKTYPFGRVDLNNNNKSHSNHNVENQDISEVKFRLDQLMNKFPVSTLNTIQKQTDFKKKNSPSEYSAPHFQIHRTNSTDGDSSVRFNTQSKVQNQRKNPQTEGKILIMEENYEPQSKYASEQLLARNTQSKGRYSLNYSQSGLNSKLQIPLPNPQIESLYHQIYEQEEAIVAYKQIIFRLQNQNMHLIQMMQNGSHQNNQINYQLNHPFQNQCMNQNCSQSAGILGRGHLLIEQSDSQKNQNSFQRVSRLSDSIHKFERQEQIYEKIDNCESKNLEPNSFQKPPKIMRTSGKIRLSLEQQVQILESQKQQLLNKIDWLNGVVQEMMSMGHKIKSDKSISADNLHQIQQRKSRRFKHPSGDIGKVSRVIQTSFVQTSSQQLNIEQIRYKQLYEKQILYHQNMKQQISELSQLQDAYGEQFELILKEINQIKKNRHYYQQLKKQIKKSQEKSLKKREKQRSQKNIPINQKHRDLHRRVFENKVIYQLKAQNQRLLNQNLKLKKLHGRNNKFENNINHSPNDIHMSSQTIFAEDFTDFSVIKDKKPQNIFVEQLKNHKKGFNNAERFSRISEFGINDQKKRPASYGNFQIQTTNRSEDNKMKALQTRKNGSILCVSQVQNVTKSRSRPMNSKVLYVQNHHSIERRNNQRNSAREQYQPRPYETKLPEEEANSRIVETSLVHQIIEEDKEQSSNCTHETSQNMIGRYNNFIKNMKQRFGINSSIIGKEIHINSISPFGRSRQ